MIKNWDDIVETSYINREDRYTLKIVEIAKDVNGNITQTSSNGKEFHKYICETKEGERITLSLYLNDSALWKYKKFASACGINTKGGAVDFDTLPNQLLGRKFVGDVKRQPPRPNIETGVIEESKYFNIEQFYPVEA